MKIAVVGAGVTGLTIARRLLERGCDVIVLEAGQAGGLAAGFEFPGTDGTWLECFYHHIFRSDRHMVELIEQMGLGGDLLWCHSRSGVFADGRIWPMTSALDLLRLRPAGSLLDRLKLGLSMRAFQKAHDWRPFDQIGCEEYFRERGCLGPYHALWRPLLKAKFGEGCDRIPAAFLWGRIYPRARSRQRGKERLGYLRGGFARLFREMVRRLEADGVDFRFGVRVKRLQRIENGTLSFRVTSGAISKANPAGAPVEDREEVFDRVVWTAQPAHLTRVLDPAEPELADRVEAIHYIGACCMILVLDKPLGGFYWVNSIDPQVSFGGCIEHTNLMGPEHYAGKHIAYLINYLSPDHAFMSLDADALLQRHLPSLRKLYPGFDPASIVEKYLFKTPAASPIYDMGFRQRMPPFVGWSRGIGLLGMSQVYPMDRNMDHCIEVAMNADLSSLLADQ